MYTLVPTSLQTCISDGTHVKLEFYHYKIVIQTHVWAVALASPYFVILDTNLGKSSDLLMHIPCWEVSRNLLWGRGSRPVTNFGTNPDQATSNILKLVCSLPGNAASDGSATASNMRELHGSMKRPGNSTAELGTWLWTPQLLITSE